MANSNSIPWAQTPDYLEMCRTEFRPGDLTAYHPPRFIGYSPTDVTTFKFGHSRLTVDNLLDVMYMIEPPEQWQLHKALAKPPQKIDPVTKEAMFEHAPRPGTTARPLLDWPVLRGIDKIGTKEDWLFFETMLKLEPGLEWADFDMRMDYVGDRATKTKAHFIKLLQQRVAKQRERFSILSWRDKSTMVSPAPRELLLSKLTPRQIENNTTRGLTPGLIDPLLPDVPANRIALPKRRGQYSLVPRETSTYEYLIESTSHANRYPPYTFLNFTATPSREPERGVVELTGQNRIEEAPRLKSEWDQKDHWTTIRYTNQEKKREKDDRDDYVHWNHDSRSLGQRQENLPEVLRPSAPQQRTLVSSEEGKIPFLLEASERNPEYHLLHSGTGYLDLDRHDLTDATASRDGFIPPTLPNTSLLLPTGFYDLFLFYLTHQSLWIRCHSYGHLKLVMSKRCVKIQHLAFLLDTIYQSFQDSLLTSPHINLHISPKTSTSEHGNAMLPG